MQRGSILPFILILVLLITIGVGVFLVKFSRTDTTSDAATNLKPQAFLLSPSPQIETTDDELIGLSFIPPEGFKVKKETEDEYFKRAFGNIRKNFTSYILYSPAEFAESFYIISDKENNPDKAAVSVWVFKNPDNLDAGAFYGKYWYYPFVWGDFSGEKSKIAPENSELVGGREGQSGVVYFRDLKPHFIYLQRKEKKLMLQIQYPDGDLTAKAILQSFKFE